MMMPVMDGIEATRHIRANETKNHVPIVAMTANAMEADRERCIEAGMDDYLSKPIKAQELQDMLRRVTHARAHATELQSINAELAPASDFSGLEFDYLGGLNAMDQEIRGIIEQAFMDEWPVDLTKLRVALASQDMRAVARTAHSLKGTLWMFGAVPARDLASEIEALASGPNAHLVAALVEPLREQVEQLILAMRRSAMA